MAEPRVIYVSGFARAGSAIQWPGGWLEPPATAVADGDWSAWRLLGANNRELGRSYFAYPTLLDCHRAVAEVQGGVTRAEPVVTISLRTGLWRWQLNLATGPAVISARSFERRRACEANLAHFCTAIPRAEGALAQPTVSASASETTVPASVSGNRITAGVRSAAAE